MVPVCVCVCVCVCVRVCVRRGVQVQDTDMVTSCRKETPHMSITLLRVKIAIIAQITSPGDGSKLAVCKI